MNPVITPVETSRDLHTFVTFPWRIYRDDPHWVPPLIGDTKKLLSPGKHPFYEHGEAQLFLARHNGNVVGRIAAIRNRAHEEYHDEPVGFFGFFECENDPEVAGVLLERARTFAREHGLKSLRGPVNPSTNEECGVLVEGFNTPPMIMMTHNPEYYDGLLHACGLRKAKDLYAYILEADEVPERLDRGADLVQRRLKDIVVRPMNKKDFDREVDAFRVIYNNAWQKNWGFVPMTDAEISHMAKELKPVVEPVLVRIAERDGKPVGFALGLPDMNQALKRANGRLFPFGLIKILWHSRGIHRARILALGILEEYRRTGLDVLLYRDLFRDGLAKGYHVGEFSWILEDNLPMLKPLENMGAKRYKTYRLYETDVPSL